MTAVIKETDFPELVEIYNTKGRREMYDHIRNCYGLKNLYFTLRRLIKSDRYAYDEALDKFHPVECESSAPEQSDLFMSLDEFFIRRIIGRKYDFLPFDSNRFSKDKFSHRAAV